MPDKFFGANGTAFSHKSVEWETPDWLFEKLDNEFHFTLDVCATDDNYKCERYYTTEDDGLAQDWGKETCFCNPPFGRGTLRDWLRKAIDSARKGATVVCLIPARTDTRFFHEFVMSAAEVRFVKGRIKFELDGKALAPAPFPSAIVVFRPFSLMRDDQRCPEFSSFDPRA